MNNILKIESLHNPASLIGLQTFDHQTQEVFLVPLDHPHKKRR